ncbi:hypothetical protein UFOVP451_47 [uncultured Caudovirales phage]|uniref:N-terminal domain-containing protein n=1 Tax=uncultured Caudovirales phage TaxID=2100421 RepID=A0A6J5MC80_9CAUD|nr:hypothetical protein UFOVP451_47 [uncultured Caudovirales phage]
MNNITIVETLRALHNIPGKLKTYAEWLNAGRQVKKGEKARVTAPLWKRVERKNKETGETSARFVLTSAALFEESQTVPKGGEKDAT